MTMMGAEHSTRSSIRVPTALSHPIGVTATSHGKA
jgi:hypothetical protein